MRITFNSQYRDSAAAIESASERLMETQSRVSSGRRIDRISTDPTGAAASVNERAYQAQVDDYTRAADSVASRLTVVDTVMSDIVQKITNARSTALSARGTTKTTAQRDAAAQELGSLREALLDDLNTQFNGAYVFSGAAVTTKPFTVPGGSTVPAYAGSSNRVQVDVGDGRAVTVAFAGEDITQGSDPQDLFATIDALITAVNAGDNDAIGTGVDALQRAFERATTAQSRLGNDMQVIDAQKLRLQQQHLSGAERLSKLEDVDMAAAITDMSHADAAYRAALGAVGTVSRVSLLDYMK
jgi:flagellar hook-associated protein 3 FlgL